MYVVCLYMYVCIYNICNVCVFASIYLFLKKKWIGRSLNNAVTAEKCKDFIKKRIALKCVSCIKSSMRESPVLYINIASMQERKIFQ